MHAAVRTPSVRAVAVLSADELDQPLAGPPGPTTARTAAGALRLPLLLAVTGGDPFVSVADTRELFTAASTPAAHKTLVVLPAGSGHGRDLVGTDPAGAAFGARLASFLLGAVSP